MLTIGDIYSLVIMYNTLTIWYNQWKMYTGTCISLYKCTTTKFTLKCYIVIKDSCAFAFWFQCLKTWEDAIRGIQAKDISQDALESQGIENSPNNVSSEERGDTMEGSSTTSEPQEGTTSSDPSG